MGEATPLRPMGGYRTFLPLFALGPLWSSSWPCLLVGGVLVMMAGWGGVGRVCAMLYCGVEDVSERTSGILAAASRAVDCWDGTCGVCLSASRQVMAMWWLPRQPCRGLLVSSVSLSLPELRGVIPCSAMLGCFRDRRDTTPPRPPPPTLSFFPRWRCARFTHSRTHSRQPSSYYSVPSTPGSGTQAQEPVWFSTGWW